MSFQIENGKLIKYILDTEETEVIIPGGITEIGEEAFAECDTLTGITIPAGVTKIGKRAFYYCTELAGIDLPEGLTEIGEGAFELCQSLMKITIPGSLESIGKDAFNLCADDQDVPAFYLPGLDYYRKNSQRLYGCRYLVYINGELLEEYTYPEGTKEIAEEDFRNCASLRRIIIPEGVTAIGQSAFENCENLEYVTLPSTLEEVGARVFYFSLHDKDVHVTSLDHFLKLNASCLPELWNYNLWVNGKPVEQLRLPAVIWEIGDNFLKGCCSLKELTIPEGVEEIGRNAFDSCRNLRRVKFPSTLHFIADSAFKNCAGLESLELPGDLFFIGESAFADCSSLKNLSIRGSRLSIGRCAFQSCAGLESVVLEDGVREIGDEAFCMCPALTGVTFPRSIEKLGDGLFVLDRFSAESNTLKITMPDMRTYFRLRITAPHYLYCAGEPVESFAFPAGMARIENHAFYSCLSLKRVTIPAGVREIGVSAFAQCRNLEEVNISEGVRIIRDSAFLCCVSLREVILPESVRSICANAFGVCDHLKTIIVKGKHVRIADGAFADYAYEEFMAPEDEILGSKRACMWGIGLKFYPAESLLAHLTNCPQRMLGKAEAKILESGNQELIQAYQALKAGGIFDHNPGARDALFSTRYTDEELIGFAQLDEGW